MISQHQNYQKSPLAKMIFWRERGISSGSTLEHILDHVRCFDAGNRISIFECLMDEDDRYSYETGYYISGFIIC